MKSSKRQLASMVFLVAALACLVAFHLLPLYVGGLKGWYFWVRIFDNFRYGRHLDYRGVVWVASFCNLSFLTVVSPLMKNVWPKSRWAWWSATIFSGVAAAAFAGLCIVSATMDQVRFEFGVWCLVTAPVLNFIGLLLAYPEGAPSRDQFT
jgi:hypothetical protein